MHGALSENIRELLVRKLNSEILELVRKLKALRAFGSIEPKSFVERFPEQNFVLFKITIPDVAAVLYTFGAKLGGVRFSNLQAFKIISKYFIFYIESVFFH